MKDPKTVPINNDELEAEILKYQASSPDKKSRTASERLGQILLDLHNNILRSKNFNRYPQEVKEDMRSDSLVRVFRWALSSWDSTKGHKAFSYLTRCIFVNYISSVMKYYKKLNQRQQYVRDQLTQLAIAGDQNAMRKLGIWTTSLEATQDD